MKLNGTSSLKFHIIYIHITFIKGFLKSYFSSCQITQISKHQTSKYKLSIHCCIILICVNMNSYELGKILSYPLARVDLSVSNISM